MIMFYFKLCLTCPIIGLKEYIMSQVSLNLMKIPFYWLVEIELHLGQRQIYTEYLFKKKKWKEVFQIGINIKRQLRLGNKIAHISQVSNFGCTSKP